MPLDQDRPRAWGSHLVERHFHGGDNTERSRVGFVYIHGVPLDLLRFDSPPICQ
jgi:hypothetical protein